MKLGLDWGAMGAALRRFLATAIAGGLAMEQARRLDSSSGMELFLSCTASMLCGNPFV
jgi:hypothetical protein